MKHQFVMPIMMYAHIEFKMYILDIAKKSDHHIWLKIVPLTAFLKQLEIAHLVMKITKSMEEYFAVLGNIVVYDHI